MSKEKEANYYLKKKKILMRLFDAAMNITKEILIETFGEERFIEISTATRKEFENLLPKIPYVGGDDNPLTDELINSALLLVLLQAFEKEGLKFDDIGKLTYELFESFYKFIPPADDIFSNAYQDKRKEQAIDSKLRKYPGDWVFDFIEGDDETFTFGMDFSECGVHKFYKGQGAEHLMPWVCIADYARAREYGYGLKRTQSIGNGAKICDFRYVKDGLTPRAWPPDNLQEYKKK
jgi:hypothetical protein